MIQSLDTRTVESSLEQLEHYIHEGYYAAGFIGYEAGHAWIPNASANLETGKFPLLWFGLYRDAVRYQNCPSLLPAAGPTTSLNHNLDVSRERYEDTVRRIKERIREGDTYQVNYTCRTKFRWDRSPGELYLRLRHSQPVSYGAFMNCGAFSILSLSPELFLRKKGETLETRPMKGTAPRDDDPVLDEKIRQWLRSDPKNKAENLMITDLMRNDFGRIARTGTVEVFDPFRIEAYNSLFQMTTGVRCKLREDLSLVDLFTATFPPGSVTGAPKVNTMRIISSLEDSPRKVYTGAIGYLAPNGEIIMSVAIRTIIATASGNCEMGVGSGIVADSQPENEFEETLLKTRFLDSDASGEIHLLETILVQKDGSLLWFDEHLDRMERSAGMLNYPFRRQKAIVAIRDHIRSRSPGSAIWRLLLNRMGEFIVETRPIYPLNGNPGRVILSRHRVDPGNDLLAHKTTARSLFDTELAAARAAGYVEVLFTNTRGYLTEGAFTNLFVHDLSGWRTPEPACGLLPGIWREKYLEETGAVQGKFSPGDLQSADRIVIGNSVRGAFEVDEIVDPDGLTLYRRSESSS